MFCLCFLQALFSLIFRALIHLELIFVYCVRENYRSISLMNTDIKVLHKILAIPIYTVSRPVHPATVVSQIFYSTSQLKKTIRPCLGSLPCATLVSCLTAISCRDFPGGLWLRLHASNAGGTGSIPGWGTTCKAVKKKKKTTTIVKTLLIRSLCLRITARLQVS